MGGDLRTLMLNVYIEGGGSPNGSFTFDNRYTGNSFANLLLGYPAQTQRQIGDAHDQHRWRAASAFFQDDWKVTPQLTVNLGVRWEVQTSAINVLKDEGAGLAVFDVATRQVVIAGAHGPQTFRNPIDRSRTITLAGGGDLSIPEGLYFTPLTDFAPRFGFAWSPEGLNMVVRGGYGIYYSPEIGTLTFNHRVSAYPWNIPQTFNADATRPNIFLSDPFPDALALSSITTSAIPTDFRHGYMQNWSLSIQRPLGTDTVLDVGYVGSKGTKMLTSRDINQPFLGPGSIDSRRPIPGWSGITMRERTSNSNYHSMQTKIERRFAGGLTFVSAYTLAHSIDDDSPNQDFYNRSADRGDSSFDVRHRLVNSYSYELPFGPGKRFLSQAGGVVSKIFGGWQLAGITTFSTGQSITPMVSGDISLTGKSSVRANRVGDGVLARDQRNASRWFDTSAFVIPATGTFGNAGRNTLKAPGLNNWDVTLTKNTRIGENHRTEFRVEFFNALNHAQFALPNTTVNSSAFGTITRAKDGRQIQFGLKLYY